MRKFLLFSIIFFVGIMMASAQNTRYIVRLKNKATSTFTIANPDQYLSARAIARRQQYNIAIDSLDLPVVQRYMDSIRLSGAVTIINVSKWLNQVAILTTDAAALAKINSFPFVISASPIAARNADGFITQKKFDNDTEATERAAFNYGRSTGQVKIHNADFLHDLGFRGEGIQMAVLDGGFFKYNTLPAFDSVRLNGQILGTYDFVKNEVSVAEDDAHGMNCLSTIAANLPGQFVGTAPKASFYLYRTEDVFSEYPIEEQNWVAGLERADSLGVQMSSTSLGYYIFDNPVFNYSYADMNGNTTIAARGGDIAARKGMLVVVSAGNEGNTAWRYIITPADADSVLAVGAVDTLGNVGSFSSFGPSSDGQIKPNVAAVGVRATVASASTGLPVYTNGTSFACPNMAGVSACLWQAFPELNNIAILNALQNSASRATNPNDRVGYGIPDVKKAFYTIEKQLYSQSVVINRCTASLTINLKTSPDIKLYLERKLPGENNYVTIDSVQGSNGFMRRTYTFNDLLPASLTGVVQYRTSIKVMTERSVLMDSLTVNKIETCMDTEAVMYVGPNPTSGKLNVGIRLPFNSNVNLQMVNAVGQRVYQNSFIQITALEERQIQMQNFAKGVYYLNLHDGKKKIKTILVVKQ